MRVLMFTPRFFPDPMAGGRATSVKNLAQALSEKGVNLDIISYWHGKIYTYTLSGQINVIKISAPPSKNRFINYLIKLKNQFLEREKLSRITEAYDIIHVHGPTYGFAFPPFLNVWIYKGWKKAVPNSKIVYHLHGSMSEEVARYISNYKSYVKNIIYDLKNINEIIVLYNKLKISLKYYLKQDQRINVVYNFIPDQFAKYDPSPEDYPAKFTVLYVGGRIKYKGYLDVIKIEKKIKDIDPSIKFIKIGPYFKHVPYNEMPKMYLSSSILLFPSYREGLPYAVMEALAMRRPVVASDVGGIPEIIEDGVNGFLLKPGDIKGFIEKILYLKEKPNEVRRMGSLGRKHVLEKFSKDRVIPQILKIYKRLLTKN